MRNLSLLYYLVTTCESIYFSMFCYVCCSCDAYLALEVSRIDQKSVFCLPNNSTIMDDTRRPDHNIHAYSDEYSDDDNNNYNDDDDIVPGFRINASSEYHNSRRNNHVGVFDNDEEDDDENDGDYDRHRTFQPHYSSSSEDDDYL